MKEYIGLFFTNVSEIFADDKSQVILALTFIAGLAVYKITDPETIITAIVSGLLGIAVGKGAKSE